MKKMLCGVLLATSMLVVTGCSGWKWWAAKQVASETGEDVAESMNLTKTKEELREDIRELRKQLRAEKGETARLQLKVRELEARCAAGAGGGLPQLPGAAGK